MQLHDVETMAYTPRPMDFRGPDWPTIAPINPQTQFAPDPPKEQYEAQHAAKRYAYRQLYTEIETRIHEILTDAVMANEPFSQDSLSDLSSFMKQISFARRPSIYLLDNGNFRVVWKNTENEQVALQFRGRGIVHCVFFHKRKVPQLPLNQETLIDVIPKVRARLSEYEHLLQG